jgi:hypothetical protein
MLNNALFTEFTELFNDPFFVFVVVHAQIRLVALATFKGRGLFGMMTSCFHLVILFDMQSIK